MAFSWRAHTICKHDRLDEESEKINNIMREYKRQDFKSITEYCNQGLWPPANLLVCSAHD